jgi:hypothetical protein
MLFRSDDYGKTWEIIGRDLPQEPVNVVKEDPKVDDMIYVGTDHGAYVSLDGGKSFHAFLEGLAGAPVHDIVVHPRDQDIIIGTHGRSLYRASALELQALTKEVLAEAIHLFKIEDQRRSRSWGRDSWSRDNAPSINLPVYASQSGTAQVSIQAEDGPVLHTYSVTLKKGLQYATYDFTYGKDAWPAYRQYLEKNLKEEETLPKMEPADDGKYYLLPGKYKVTFKMKDQTSEQVFELK